ncbi:unnamed protein product [Protopolystoma xenopodis]|uniref:Srp40 C-terminal domain-containing protein n=1 Tax=Protopolystoma xenopodis TaxID=117903 RepID=A0A448WGY1_9PLAT|nr:unnamed protein product [Protopolystoma xenopodis]
MDAIVYLCLHILTTLFLPRNHLFSDSQFTRSEIQAPFSVGPKPGSSKAPYRRVRDDEVNLIPALSNNSFEAKLGAQGSWGERANQALKLTRGKEFKHEKTKRKRGTYTGGTISTNVCSFKFNE